MSSRNSNHSKQEDKVKSKVFLLVIISVFVFASQVLADVPRMINYQGKLTSPEGALIDDTLSIVFTIYDAATDGGVLWTETQATVVVEKGIFSVLLGSVNEIPDSVFDGSIRYLGITVGDDSEMSPRKAIVSVGYTYKAEYADTAEYARTGALDNDWAVDGDNIYREHGNVGIGTITPIEKLQVAGVVHSTAGGFKFPDETIQTTAAAGGGDTAKFAWNADSLNGHNWGDLYPDADKLDGQHASYFTPLSQFNSHSSNPSAHHEPVTSVNGLSGGTITSGVYVNGLVSSYGPNGNLNARLNYITENSNYGHVGVYDASGTRRAGLYVNTTGGGQMHALGPNGDMNTYLGYLTSYPNNGYVGVLDASGNWKAAIYVNSSGQGVVWGDVKSFRIANPKQPGTEIWYACLEGPEAAAYVRGTGHLTNGKAEILLPDHFVAVANPEGITVHLTPLSGESKGLAVVEKALNRFVVQELAYGDGTYDFDYTVMAVRKGHEDYQVIRSALEAKPAETGLSAE